LHDEVQLRGNEADYYNIENSLLPDVIETGLGIPLSLSVVYMMVGLRAGMSVEGVGLPGHFLVRHEDIFFDPFHGGRRIGLEECRELMRRQHLELRPEHLAAATSRQILLRMLANIFAIAEKTDPQLAEKLAGWIGSLRT
jgi:regulator of sirC expression with transglutaminase-like and TPR domain